MKKLMNRSLAAFLALLLLLELAGCGTGIKSADFITEKNLMENASMKDDGANNISNGKWSGSKNSYLKISFPQEVTLNTVVLREKGSHIRAFQIQIPSGDDYKTIYQNDKVDAYRYCAFPEVTTSSLRLVVTDGADFTLEGIEAYRITGSKPDHCRVTSYVVTDSIYDRAAISEKHFDVITDVILFGSLSFDKDGNLSFQDKEIGGKQIGGQQVFETALRNVREAVGERDVHLYVNLLGPDAPSEIEDWNESMYAKADLHKSAMTGDNGKKLIRSITELLEKYGLDGVFFDWEYPLRKKDWEVFDQFILALDGALGEKKLGIAVQSWALKASKEAIEKIDLAEVMTYDMFDEDGYHAPFYPCAVTEINALLKKGFQKEQLDFGVPFYARPTDRAAQWFDYQTEAEKLGWSGNVATGPQQVTEWQGGTPVQVTATSPRYYNGCQMIYDKTAYAMDFGLGGMMVWNYAGDLPYENPLSLFRAMETAISQRS